MKIKLILAMLLFYTITHGQQYINEGMIEYEMRINNTKAMGDGLWADLFKDKIPQFSTYYYHLTFSDNKSVYKYDHMDEKTKLPWNDDNDHDNVWYNDYNTKTFTNFKSVFGDNYIMSDTLMNIKWRLVPNEIREIAGFSCRKAQAVIFDSVYIFAYYTDEITAPAGPMGLQGLPGTILGITIPRMFSSWIATKIQIVGVNTSVIVPPTKGKKKKATDLLESVKKATADWGHWGQQAVWNIFL
ncbi:MAG: GLPGLI family protein [Chitinophagaceae bacterium]